ncbi:MAG TPA: hypothetical protein VMR21_14525 [Vicinamibacteria bacterium]|nr:hypothetical protein [Vicinamibacteria bacterium]
MAAGIVSRRRPVRSSRQPVRSSQRPARSSRRPASPPPRPAALLGWAFIYLTTDPRVIAVGVVTLALGVVAFLVWSWRVKSWPFAPSPEPPVDGRR